MTLKKRLIDGLIDWAFVVVAVGYCLPRSLIEGGRSAMRTAKYRDMILISGRRQKTPAENLAVMEAQAVLDEEDVQYISNEDVDWDVIHRREGNYASVCRWAGRTFKGVVLVEGQDDAGRFVSRGQTLIAQSAIGRGKRIAAIRDGKLCAVSGVSVVNSDEWATRYAELRVAS